MTLEIPEGWQDRHTGGGCRAWELEVLDEHGEYFADVWIAEEGVYLPSQDTELISIQFMLHKSEFESGSPPKMFQHIEGVQLKVQEGDDVNGDCWWYYARISEDQTAHQIAEAIRNIPKTTFIKEVVIAQNNPTKEEQA